MRFARTERFVGHEHDSELTENGIEGLIVERETRSIRLFPLDRFALPELLRSVLEHRLVQICRDQSSRRG
jgi:hypothetical protein